MFIAPDYWLLTDVLSMNNNQSLARSIEYRLVAAAWKPLVKDPHSVQTFVRVADYLEPTYVLLRNNQLQQDDTLLGVVLRTLLDEPREGPQKFNGGQLPQFQLLRRYLGAGGWVGYSLEDGWQISGFALKK